MYQHRSLFCYFTSSAWGGGGGGVQNGQRAKCNVMTMSLFGASRRTLTLGYLNT